MPVMQGGHMLRIDCSGTVTRVPLTAPTLQCLQQGVGGYIQVVPLTPDSGPSPAEMICDEEGKMHRRPLNGRATSLFGHGDIIVGPVLITPPPSEDDGHTQGFTDDECDAWAEVIESLDSEIAMSGEGLELLAMFGYFDDVDARADVFATIRTLRILEQSMWADKALGFILALMAASAHWPQKDARRIVHRMMIPYLMENVRRRDLLIMTAFARSWPQALCQSLRDPHLDLDLTPYQLGNLLATIAVLLLICEHDTRQAKEYAERARVESDDVTLSQLVCATVERVDVMNDERARVFIDGLVGALLAPRADDLSEVIDLFDMLTVPTGLAQR